MNNIKTIFTGLVLLFLMCASVPTEIKRVKCLIELNDYVGEGAYVVISLMAPDNSYVKTIYVNGDDNEWYYELSAWWKHYGRNKYALDGITGSTIASGAKKVNVFSIPAKYLNKGYSLRFETAVEKKNYFKEDLVVKLKSNSLSKKHTGKGFVNYVRFLPL